MGMELTITSSGSNVSGRRRGNMAVFGTTRGQRIVIVVVVVVVVDDDVTKGDGRMALEWYNVRN